MSAKGKNTEENRRPVVYNVTPDAEMAPDEPETDEEIAFGKFQSEFAESDGYAKLTVWRQPTGPANRPGQRKMNFLFECGVDEFTFSQLCSKLRDSYGSGTYRIQARNQEGYLMFNRSVAIEREANPTKPPESTTDIFAAVERIIEASQQRTEQMLSRVSQPAANNGMGSVLEMFKTMGACMAAMAPIFQPQRGNDVLGEIEKLIKLKELASAFGGDGGDKGGADSNFYDLAGKLVDKLGPAFITAVNAKAQQNTTPALAAPNPITPVASPSQQSEPSMKSQIDILVANAKSGVTAETMATTILDMTPDSKLESLYQFVSAPDCLDKMAGMNPEVSSPALSPWFEALRKFIIEELQAPEDSATVPPAST